MSLAGIATEAFFLPAAPGARFCLLNVPAAGRPVRGAILHVPAFTEEMNKSRRAVALTARALAANGWAVLQLDLLGCGDSSGEFGDAAWATWLDDVARGYRWLEAKYRLTPVMWGLRLGALLAAQCLPHLGAQPDLMFWQPVVSGRLHLTQFLRLKVAGRVLGNAEHRTDTRLLRDRLAAGETLEIAGYSLAPALGEPMASAELDIPEGYQGDVWWCDITNPGSPAMTPASQAKITAWRARGISVRAEAVPDLPFWQTQEIAESPALVDATVRSRIAVAG